METVELKLDEDNSLVFEVKIEGDSRGQPIYRLVCEAGNMSYGFKGEPSEDGIQVTIPKLAESLRPGTYDAHLEVVIENKLFIPLQFQTKFDVSTKVVAEAVKVVSKKPVENVVSASVSVVKKTETKIPTPAVKQKVQTEAKKTVTLRDMYAAKQKKKV